MLKPPKGCDVLHAACAVLEGFSQVQIIEDGEMKSLRTLVACRLATSVTLGAYSISKDTSNEYLKLHAKPGREALKKYWSLAKIYVQESFHQSIEKGSKKRKKL